MLKYLQQKTDFGAYAEAYFGNQINRNLRLFSCRLEVEKMASTMTKNLNVAMSPQMLSQLRAAAQKMGVSPPQLARWSLALYLERGIDYGPIKKESEVKTHEPSPAR